MRFRMVAAVFAWLVVIGGPVTAQDNVWIQVEAHRSLSEAGSRAADFSVRLDSVAGFSLRSGWNAIVIGPVRPDEAPAILRQLIVTRQIPSDSYVVSASSFRTQFWPADGQASSTVLTTGTGDTTQTAQVTPTPEIEPSDETPAQARRSEALLTRDEKMELQSALAWDGFYNSAIDGAIGRGSRNAMAAWQGSNGYEATGILTSKQRVVLLGAYRGFLSSIGIEQYLDDLAGIEIDLPLALVAPGRNDPPFVRFDPKNEGGPQVYLISQAGDRDTLAALYEILQTLTIIPVEGPRRLRNNSFLIEGQNADKITTAYGELSGDDVKGYILVWPQDELRKRDLVWARMQQSFKPQPGYVLPDDAATSEYAGPDLFAGLAIRRPAVIRSGFFVSQQGAILTSADVVQNCERITIGDDVNVDISASTDALALLSPRVAQRPISIATLSTEALRPASEIAVSGYSYGGKLGAPSLTFGTLSDMVGLSGETNLRRLNLPATQTDAGGPIVSASGSVLGMLLPPPTSGRLLPDDIHLAASADHLLGFMADNGIGAEPAPELVASFAPRDLAMKSADMTVLVSCWR